MRTDPHEQGTPEWHAARLGIPTASAMHRVLTPKTLKPSGQRRGYMLELVAEWLTGEAGDSAAGAFLDRGIEMEERARNWYAIEFDKDPVECGLCLTDDGRIGASPDALVGEDGLLEIKCPKASKHVGYLLDGPGADYRLQVQTQLWVTGRAWLDFVSYNPVIRSCVLRVEPDADVVAKLDEHLPAFCDELDALKARLRSDGHVPASERAPRSLADLAGVSGSDAEFDAVVDGLSRLAK